MWRMAGTSQGFISSSISNVPPFMNSPSINHIKPYHYNLSSHWHTLPKVASFHCMENGKTCRDLHLMGSSKIIKDAIALPHAVVSQSNVSDRVSDSYATATINEAKSTDKGSQDGIGIVKFLEGKSYLITGATGLLAKVLIEKMLRTSPGIGKIYILVKANDEEHALHRVISEIIECELFEKVKTIHGSKYYDFMTSKLVPVVGDVGEVELGIDNDFSNTIAQQVDVIIHSAASTSFHERYDVALNINTKGPHRLMSFAKKCKKLRLFLHVSTAYVNGERKGRIMEKSFNMGDSIAAEKQLVSQAEILDFPKLDIDYEIRLTSELVKTLHENEVAERMKELGLMRARMYGWSDTYTFSKAMGEMMLNKYRDQVPVVIVRPSIIESTYNDPFPGWIQGNRMLDPLILSYGKGLLPGYMGDPDCVMDVVPVDMVVNTMLCTMAKHGAEPYPDLNIYHAASSVENPITLHDVFAFSFDHFRSSPIVDSKYKNIDVMEMKFFNSIDNFSNYIYKEMAERVGQEDNNEASLSPAKIETKCARIMNYLLHIAEIYTPYMFYERLFDNKNSQRLMEDMSAEELKDFPINMRSINWQHYFSNIHIPTLKRLFTKQGRLPTNVE